MKKLTFISVPFDKQEALEVRITAATMDISKAELLRRAWSEFKLKHAASGNHEPARETAHAHA